MVIQKNYNHNYILKQQQVDCTTIKRSYTTVFVNFVNKVEYIFSKKKEKFVRRLKNNAKVEKQLAQLNIASWMSCIRMYAKNHVETLSNDTIKIYLINVHQWSTKKEKNKFFHNLVDEFYSHNNN